MATDDYNKTSARLRVLAVWGLVIALVALSKPTPLSVWLGFPFVMIGELLRCWAAGHLHKTVRLITSGPYSYTRNPLYLGRLLIFTGIAIMAALPYRANWIVLVCGYVIFFAYYLPRKETIEPARLWEMHGERFGVYHDNVPALLPRLQAWPGGSNEGWHSARFSANREHWMAIAMALISLTLMVRAYFWP